MWSGFFERGQPRKHWDNWNDWEKENLSYFYVFVQIMYNAWQLIWRFDVTVTTFTDVFAFLVGSNTVLPGLGNYNDDNDTDNENYNNNVVIDDDEYENF